MLEERGKGERNRMTSESESELNSKVNEINDVNTLPEELDQERHEGRGPYKIEFTNEELWLLNGALGLAMVTIPTIPYEKRYAMTDPKKIEPERMLDYFNSILAVSDGMIEHCLHGKQEYAEKMLWSIVKKITCRLNTTTTTTNPDTDTNSKTEKGNNLER